MKKLRFGYIIGKADEVINMTGVPLEALKDIYCTTERSTDNREIFRLANGCEATLKYHSPEKDMQELKKFKLSEKEYKRLRAYIENDLKKYGPKYTHLIIFPPRDGRRLNKLPESLKKSGGRKFGGIIDQADEIFNITGIPIEGLRNIDCWITGHTSDKEGYLLANGCEARLFRSRTRDGTKVELLILPPESP